MPKISASSIKKLVKDSSGVTISNSAADAISRILEKKAKRIAKYAVKRAKDKKRSTVLEEDIDTYRLKFGD
ncbi:MAG: NFYB/HAP3 family transcription factor subunit [Candidatus Micrarchaeota archaeon]|nr:NFYB/HAP3 family transcription factor subunit [Candidatus Micrarchaeota archaeon]